MAQGSRKRLEVFVVVKGHPFARDPFEAMLRAIGVEPTMVDQPAAAMLLNPDAMHRFDAILFYDMPGLDFRVPAAELPALIDPDPAFKAGFLALLAAGKGMVALHHAIAGWPAWPIYAEALGGLFLYKPQLVRGRLRPESGYIGNVRYTARLADNRHPILQDMPGRFDLVDELYLNELFDDPTLMPLLYRETPIPSDCFHSAMRAVRHLAEDDAPPWVPSAQSPLLGWAKAAGTSPLVYLQPGDNPQTYANPHYRRLVGNALRWVASDGGSRWARQRSIAAGQS
ncbi:ThuA domain-containing protein [Sphingomonas flavalba]|uniref:ThuA domain-containing protein n=1 Tax=Sphingomonas flavalba TaxID=2559804 RepID=UPI00109DD05E|nr:ThuA domain-containing protein [Sphingomonas flavalba]